MAHTHAITIYSTEYVGSGYCTPENGDIECAAEIGDLAYALIEQALIDGETEVTVEGARYHWTLTPR